MLINLPTADFAEYPVLTPEQKTHVQWLMWDYYRLAWHEMCKQFNAIEDCPYTMTEMMALDLHELELDDEFELCQLIKDTIENSEQFHRQSLRGYRSYGKKDM